MMTKPLMTRLSDDLYRALMERKQLSKKTISQIIADLVEIGIQRSPDPIADALVPILTEINDLKNLMKVMQRNSETLTRLKARIERTEELAVVMVKSLNGIEAYLEKHSEDL